VAVQAELFTRAGILGTVAEWFPNAMLCLLDIVVAVNSALTVNTKAFVFLYEVEHS